MVQYGHNCKHTSFACVPGTVQCRIRYHNVQIKYIIHPTITHTNVHVTVLTAIVLCHHSFVHAYFFTVWIAVQ